MNCFYFNMQWSKTQEFLTTLTSHMLLVQGRGSESFSLLLLWHADFSWDSWRIRLGYASLQLSSIVSSCSSTSPTYNPHGKHSSSCRNKVGAKEGKYLWCSWCVDRIWQSRLLWTDAQESTCTHSQKKREPPLEEETMLLPINVFLEYMCIFYQQREYLQAYLVCKEELSMQFLKEMLLLKEESSVAPQGLQ